jgi:hypothetical protein
MKTHRSTMRNRQVGRWLWRLVLGSALALAVLLVCGLFVLKVHDLRVERAMGRFRAAPSAQHAARLTRLLAERAITPEQGARILTLLLWPEIVTRTAYPVGESAGISVERPFSLSVAGYRLEFQEQVWGGERLMDTSGTFTGTLYDLPEILNAWTEPAKPGVYHAELHTGCRIVDIAPRKLTLWQRLSMDLRRRLGRPFVRRAPATGGPIYECQFTVPVDLNVVEKDRAEQLELMADPQTDEDMRGTFSIETSERHGAYGTPAGRRGYRGSMSVTFKALPVAAAFELSLQLAGGRELPLGPNRQPQRIRIRAGESGAFVVNVDNFGITDPGDYAGTLILRPDPNYAYEDPAIKSIWNGTLEFPISFVVYVRTQTE